jgi:hypothetical protein
MEQRVSLITLGVADLARARAFYEALGWTTGAGPDDDVVFFQAGGMIVALWDRGQLAEDSVVADAGGWGGITLAHNVRSPADVDAVLVEAEGAGATIARPGAETFWAASRVCSSISTGTRGRSPTTPTGRSGLRARSASRRDSTRRHRVRRGLVRRGSAGPRSSFADACRAGGDHASTAEEHAGRSNRVRMARNSRVPQSAICARRASLAQLGTAGIAL